MFKRPAWVEEFEKEILDEYFGEPLQIGKEYTHPNGRPVRVTSRQYMGTYGLSNFWYWTYLDTGEQDCGYGWSAKAENPQP